MFVLEDYPVNSRGQDLLAGEDTFDLVRMNDVFLVAMIFTAKDGRSQVSGATVSCSKVTLLTLGIKQYSS